MCVCVCVCVWLIEFCQENVLVIANTLFQQHKRRIYTWTSPVANNKIRLIIFFSAKHGEALYSQQKQDWEYNYISIKRIFGRASHTNFA